MVVIIGVLDGMGNNGVLLGDTTLASGRGLQVPIMITQVENNMNERIKELAMEHFSVWPDEDELEFFVKHLLRYCTTICNTVSGDQIDNASKDYQEGREIGAIECRNKIKEYFGVKE